MGGALANSTVASRSELLRPYPQFSSINLFEPQGWSTYHALQVEFERPMAAGLTWQANYTFSKTMDGLAYLNAADPAPERVISAQHSPQIWKSNMLFEFPAL